MSGYEQRARDYLDRFTEEPTWDVYSPDAQAALEAIFESTAAEAHARAIEQAAREVPEFFVVEAVPRERPARGSPLIPLRDRIRALAPDPDLVVVRCGDLRHHLHMCDCSPSDMTHHLARWREHVAGDNRIRAALARRGRERGY